MIFYEELLITIRINIHIMHSIINAHFHRKKWIHLIINLMLFKIKFPSYFSLSNLM